MAFGAEKNSWNKYLIINKSSRVSAKKFTSDADI